MGMLKRGVLGVALVSSLGLVVGCAETEQPQPSTDGGTGASEPTVTAPTPQSKRALLGTVTGHVDGKTGKITLEKLTPAAATHEPGVTPQAFSQVTDDTFGITTLDSNVAGQPVNGITCAANRFCAQVQVTNSTGKNYNDVFIEVTSITAGYEGANSTDLTTTYQGFPLDNSKGLWAFGNIQDGSSGQSRWEFNAPDTNDFVFNASVFATRIPLAYSLTPAAGVAADFVDACTLTGATTVLQNDSSGGAVAVSIPFPFNIYDQEFTLASGGVGISAFGTLGFSAPSGGPATLGDLPTASDDDMQYNIAGFWAALHTGAKGVCYATSGTAGSRKFFATWNDANLGGTEDITFTTEIDEATDAISVVFSRWSSVVGGCKTSTATRGQGTAAIGVKATGTTVQEDLSLSAAKLPNIGAFNSCSIFKVAITPTF